jgi:hypothetical protein
LLCFAAAAATTFRSDSVFCPGQISIPPLLFLLLLLLLLPGICIMLA